jgi:hypothetical protein
MTAAVRRLGSLEWRSVNQASLNPSRNRFDSISGPPALIVGNPGRRFKRFRGRRAGYVTKGQSGTVANSPGSPIMPGRVEGARIEAWSGRIRDRGAGLIAGHVDHSD